MEANKKLLWKCQTCTTIQPKTKSYKATTSGYNKSETSNSAKNTPTTSVTQPKKKHIEIQRSSSLTDDSYDSLDSSQTNLSMRSLDLPKNSDLSTIDCLKVEIQQLKISLESAMQEIDNLVLENGELKKQIGMQQEQINTLKDICSSPPTHKKKHKGRRDQTTLSHSTPLQERTRNYNIEVLNKTYDLGTQTGHPPTPEDLSEKTTEREIYKIRKKEDNCYWGQTMRRISRKNSQVKGDE